jgi:hypothetical protein
MNEHTQAAEKVTLDKISRERLDEVLTWLPKVQRDLSDLAIDAPHNGGIETLEDLAAEAETAIWALWHEAIRIHRMATADPRYPPAQKGEGGDA